MRYFKGKRAPARFDGDLHLLIPQQPADQDDLSKPNIEKIILYDYIIRITMVMYVSTKDK